MPKGYKYDEPRYSLTGLTIQEVQFLHKLLFGNCHPELHDTRKAVAELLATDGKEKAEDAK
jgi:hypothetical protein